MNAGIVVGLTAPMAVHAADVTERIEITGSRLTALTTESISPVNVISAQDIKWDGIQGTANIINQLPSAFATQGNNVSNGATGTSELNLRNLGASRTLVLIDGKRMPAGSPQSWPVDVNAIPSPLIERVEVLTGGASAVYGSDAIAGVVNFIMNDHFEGVQFQWNGNGYNHHQQNTFQSLKNLNAVNPTYFPIPGNVGLDGETNQFSLLVGGNFANGKGNATLFFNYRKAKAVLQGTRNFSACALSSSATGFVCGGGSGTTGSGYFYGPVAIPGRTSPPAAGPFTVADAAGALKPLTAADRFNFAPYNYYQRPERQYSFNAFAHYDALPSVRVYGEFDFSNNHTVAQIAPGGAFIAQYTLQADNPLLTGAFKNQFGITPGNPQDEYIGRRNIEGGGRQQDINLEDFRYVVGAKGAIFDNTWNYNAWYQTATNRLSQKQLNYFSITKLTRALDVVPGPGGVPTCRSVIDGSDTACVPYDLYHTGGVTQAALDYLQTPSFSGGKTGQNVTGINFDSDLGEAYGWRTPWAKNGAAIALGFEHRKESLEFSSDSLSSSGDLSGSGGASPPVDGSYTVNEFYAEARLPILERQPWAYLLNIQGSYRHSKYKDPDNTANTYGLGAQWSPIKEYTLRSTYQRAIRAPNILELFLPLGLNLFNMVQDPCGTPAGGAPTATLEQCLRTGLAASRYGATNLVDPAGQYQFQQGGNPNLKPEKAKTWTVGLVAQPMSNLSATVDWWSIKLDDAIGVVPQPLILQNCLLANVFCDQVFRSANGSLRSGAGFIGGITTNTGKVDTSGIDITANWSTPIQDYGSVSLNLVGTWVDKYKFSIGVVTADCAGYFGPICGNPIPEWRHKLRGTWNTPWYNTALALTWRYFAEVKVDASNPSPALAASFFPIDKKLAAQNYFDLAFSWAINKNFQVYAGINNIFDNDPPLASSLIAGPPFGNGNTYPQIYDTLGRNLFINFTAKF
jgi:outer membrane receptor protein involved in Fe transport